MTFFEQPAERLLALDPCHRGVGFVVLDAGARLVDWGVHRVSTSHHAAVVGVVRVLIERYRPGRIVTECVTVNERRGKWAKRLIQDVVGTAAGGGIPASHYTINQVNSVFGPLNAMTKESRARLIAERFPVLELYRPPHRRPWMSEDPRMAIFDAMSFAITHLTLEQEQDASKAEIPF